MKGPATRTLELSTIGPVVEEFDIRGSRDRGVDLLLPRDARLPPGGMQPDRLLVGPGIERLLGQCLERVFTAKFLVDLSQSRKPSLLVFVLVACDRMLFGGLLRPRIAGLAQNLPLLPRLVALKPRIERFA